MMRPPAEAPSDFQEYTLVACVAVAAHLSQFHMGERFGLPLLARRYRQDVDALEQVRASRGWRGWVRRRSL